MFRNLVDDDHVSAVPAFNLNLTSVLFASAAPAASSISGFLANGSSNMTANTYTLRYQSSGSEKAVISADKASVTVTGANGKYLVVQDEEGVYAQQIASNDETTVTASQMGTGSLTSFANCKVWVEATDNNIITAKMAEQGNGDTNQSDQDKEDTNQSEQDNTITEQAEGSSQSDPEEAAQPEAPAQQAVPKLPAQRAEAPSENEKDEVPKTGAPAPEAGLMLLTALAGISGTGIFYFGRKKKTVR